MQLVVARRRQDWVLGTLCDIKALDRYLSTCCNGAATEYGGEGAGGDRSKWLEAERAKNPSRVDRRLARLPQLLLLSLSLKRALWTSERLLLDGESGQPRDGKQTSDMPLK